MARGRRNRQLSHKGPGLDATDPTEVSYSRLLQVKLGIPYRYSISSLCLYLNISKLATELYVPQGGYKGE